MNEATKRAIIRHASEEGDRVVIDGKIKWQGLGNRSGLHDYARTAINDKWVKSGTRFSNMLDELPDTTRIEILEFHNLPGDRDRGRWHVIRTFIINS